MNTKVVNIALYASTLAFIAYLRLFMSFAVTETLGPLIASMIKMVNDILTFLILFIIQLIGFSLFGVIYFFEVKEFTDFYESVKIMFYASFGSYDLAIFDVYKDDRPAMMYIGHVFLILYVTANLFLLLNMVVAMMADTYANMSEVKRGLYNFQVLRIVPYYRLHKYYGLAVALTPPFHVLCLPFAWAAMLPKGSLSK